MPTHDAPVQGFRVRKLTGWGSPGSTAPGSPRLCWLPHGNHPFGGHRADRQTLGVRNKGINTPIVVFASSRPNECLRLIFDCVGTARPGKPLDSTAEVNSSGVLWAVLQWPLRWGGYLPMVDHVGLAPALPRSRSSPRSIAPSRCTSTTRSGSSPPSGGRACGVRSRVCVGEAPRWWADR